MPDADSNVQWKGLEKYPSYQMSTDGQIRSLTRLVRGRWPGSTKRIKGRVLRPWSAGEGYKAVYLCQEGRSKAAYVHHLVLETFVGPRPRGMEAAHGDGDKANNRLTNLRWATKPDNHADKRLHGTLQYGEKQYRAKLTDEFVSELRAAKLVRGDQTRIAVERGVSVATINNALKGDTWKHLPNKADPEDL